ncbi:hypothetical protein ALC56_13067, partial [Trachymyrmex septentrionalis]
IRACDFTRAGNKEVERLEAEVDTARRESGRRAKAKQETGQKKLTKGEKVAFVNTREKGKADRTKEKLREIPERMIKDMRKEIRDWLERELKEEWAKQMEEAEVRVRRLTKKGRERTGSSRREESDQDEVRNGVSGRGRYVYRGRIGYYEREKRRLNFVIKGINIEEGSKDKEKGQRRRKVWIKEWIKEKLTGKRIEGVGKRKSKRRKYRRRKVRRKIKENRYRTKGGDGKGNKRKGERGRVMLFWNCAEI